MQADLPCFTVALTNDFVHGPQNPSNAISTEHKTGWQPQECNQCK